MNVLPSVVLVVATLTMGLGLGAMTASLAPSGEAPGNPAHNRAVVVTAGDGGLPRGSPGLRRDGDQPRAQPPDVIGPPAATALPPVSATGPWKSPLYPQNGVTLWDRIRVSSQRDRRAFLLGTAIQIHAAATASTIPDQDSPPCCPRS